MKSPTDVVKHSVTDPPSDRPNFQALAYLAYHRTQHPGERLEFTFFHFLETLDDVVAGEADFEECLSTVRYYPVTFDAFVASEAAYDRLCDGYADCRGTFEALGYAAYREVVRDLAFPETTDRDELRASAFAAEFAEGVLARCTADADVEKGCDQALRLLAGVRKRNYFREDVDAFEAFVEETIAELNRYRAGGERFPVGDANLDWTNNRDCILTDDA